MKNVIARMILVGVALVAPAAAIGASQTQQQQTPEQPKVPRPAPKLSTMDAVKHHLQRYGATVDEAKSQADMVVSSYTNEKGKVKIVILNDHRKELLQFYVYDFGSVKDLANRDEIDKYLLLANESLSVGAFFVDKDQDIGFKYTMSAQQLSYSSFESVYGSIVVIANTRRAEIRRLLKNGTN
jgi:hypothetical protein